MSTQNNSDYQKKYINCQKKNINFLNPQPLVNYNWRQPRLDLFFVDSIIHNLYNDILYESLYKDNKIFKVNLDNNNVKKILELWYNNTDFDNENIQDIYKNGWSNETSNNNLYFSIIINN